MPSLYIREFKDLARDAKGEVIPAPMEPALAQQKVTIGAGSAASAALNAETRFVELTSDTDCHYTFGTSPTAADTDMNLTAGVTKFLGVQAGQSMKIACIQE